jgi:hypothetical protein
MSKEEMNPNRPIMDFDNIIQNKFYNDEDEGFSAVVKNVGNVAARKTNFLSLGLISDKILEKEFVRNKINSLVNVIRDIDYRFEIDENQMQPSSSYRIRVQSAEIEKLLDLHEKGEEKPFLLNEDELKKFKGGEIYIYVFLVGTFSDEVLPKKAFWAYGSCQYYTQTFRMPSSCWYNHNIKVSEDRFE